MPTSKGRAYARRYSKLHANGFRVQGPALGSMRRMQALRRIGYTLPQLAEATGLSEVFIRHLSDGRFTNIDRRRIGKLTAVYDALSMRPQHGSASAKKARAFASKKGWYPPLAWDDPDDPNDYPSIHEKRRSVA